MCEYLTLEQAQAELSKSSPGLDGYAFQSDVYCLDCAASQLENLAGDFPMTDLDLAMDSEKVPTPIFFGEADHAVHCADCGLYLYGTDAE